MIKLLGKTYGKEKGNSEPKDLFDCDKTQIQCKTKKKKQTSKYFQEKIRKIIIFFSKCIVLLHKSRKRI